jgi:hypothetical protein
MWLPEDVADLYDDWYRDEHDNPPFVDQAGQLYLEGNKTAGADEEVCFAPEGLAARDPHL